MAKSYSEKLRDPRWQQRRLEILSRDKFTCRFCDDKETELHVHHRNYIKNRDPWDYDDDNLITLCLGCHELVEKLKRQINALIDREDCFGAFHDLCWLLKNDDYQKVELILIVLARAPRLIDPIYQLLIERCKKYPQTNPFQETDSEVLRKNNGDMLPVVST